MLCEVFRGVIKVQNRPSMSAQLKHFASPEVKLEGQLSPAAEPSLGAASIRLASVLCQNMSRGQPPNLVQACGGCLSCLVKPHGSALNGLAQQPSCCAQKMVLPKQHMIGRQPA